MKWTRMMTWAMVSLTVIMGLTGCATHEPTLTQEVSSRDALIAREAIDRLNADSVTGRYAFNVIVQNGVATVEGAVPDESFRLRVLGIVRATKGVQQVVDRLYRMK